MTSGSVDKSIRLWDIDSGEMIVLLEMDFLTRCQVDVLKVFGDGSFYSGNGDGSIRSSLIY